MSKLFIDERYVGKADNPTFAPEQILRMFQVFEEVCLVKNIAITSNEQRDTLALAIMHSGKTTRDVSRLRKAGYMAMNVY
jgi:hypothetical protein